MVNTTADIIIIGAGVHGASLAFHLAGRGLDVLVLERKFLAGEATGYSSGLVRMHYDLEIDAHLAWESFRYFRSWSEMVGGDCGFTRTGFLQFVPPEHISQLRANIIMQQALGIPTLVVDREDVKRLAPAFAVEDIVAAAYEPESGHADPSATTAALMNAARQRSARLMQECPVTAIRVENGKVQGVDTPQGKFDAPLVVDAAGAWAGKVAHMAGVAIPIDTWRHETAFVRRPAGFGPPHPTVIDDIHAMYFRPETGGLTLVGLEDGNTTGESPEDNTGKARPGFVERAVERLCQRVPAMIDGHLVSTQAGFDGLSPDQRAVIGPAGPDGFWLDCGFSGTGFKIAPAVGASLAEWIIDGMPEMVDIRPLSPERFESGSLLRGEHSYGDTWK